MRRGEVGKKTPKQEMDNPHFYDVTWLILKDTLSSPLTKLSELIILLRLLNDTEIAKAKRDFELKKAAYDVEVQSKVKYLYLSIS